MRLIAGGNALYTDASGQEVRVPAGAVIEVDEKLGASLLASSFFMPVIEEQEPVADDEDKPMKRGRR